MEKDGAFFKRSSGRPNSYWPGPGADACGLSDTIPFRALEPNVQRGVMSLETRVYDVGLGLTDRDRPSNTLP